MIVAVVPGAADDNPRAIEFADFTAGASAVGPIHSALESLNCPLHVAQLAMDVGRVAVLVATGAARVHPINETVNVLNQVERFVDVGLEVPIADAVAVMRKFVKVLSDPDQAVGVSNQMSVLAGMLEVSVCFAPDGGCLAVEFVSKADQFAVFCLSGRSSEASSCYGEGCEGEGGSFGFHGSFFGGVCWEILFLRCYPRWWLSDAKAQSICKTLQSFSQRPDSKQAVSIAERCR
ncbi:MAG: hypothetical protein ACI8UO_004429 [Verrucomicrobiales bacterium]